MLYRTNGRVANLFICGFAAIGLVAGCATADDPALTDLRQRIEAGEIPNVHSVLIARHGRIASEWYFSGPDERRGEQLGNITFDAETIHDLRSATKSVVSILFGIAFADGAIESLDTSVLDYFPEYQDLQTDERRKIQLHHLLSMSSGLHWDEDTYPYTDPRNSETAMDLASDRLYFALSQELEAAPGLQFRYSGGDVAIIAEIIARATKMPIDEFARKKLFEPLGVSEFEWIKDESGTPIAASGLRMLPRGMMRIGLMMLGDGQYEGRQIITTDWAQRSVEPHTVVDREPGCGTNYGYFWWLGPACPEIDDPAWYSAFGNGGQRIFVVPEYDLVIVVTAGLYNDRRQRGIREITASAISWASQSDSANP